MTVTCVTRDTKWVWCNTQVVLDIKELKVEGNYMAEQLPPPYPLDAPEKAPLSGEGGIPSAPPPDAPHAPSEPYPPQYSASAYPPPSSDAPGQAPYPPTAQPAPYPSQPYPYPSQPYPPPAAGGPPAGSTGYPASVPPVSVPPAVSFSIQSDSRGAISMLVIVKTGESSVCLINKCSLISRHAL